jgi:PAS domain S-box-containing protein
MEKLRFLLLEDSLLDTELIQEYLETSGIDCEIIPVVTRTEYLTALENNSFDLILSDYTLPSFDGISALKIAQQICPDLPFIFVTATLGEEVAIETLKSGATDYVLKQKLGRLAQSVKRALREQREKQARKLAEAELYRREQEFRALVENSPDIIARLDPQLRHLYVNPAIIQATGISSENFLGKTNRELEFPEKLCDAWEASLQQVLITGEGGMFDFEFPTPNGTRYYQSRIVPEFALDGSIQSLLSITRDVTDDKLAELALRNNEAKLRQQAKELEQANRLKDEFLAVLSHELRSPLNPILGWATLLQSRQCDQVTTKRALQTIERNAMLQTRLIEDLLDISRIMQGKLKLNSEPINLISTIEAAIETMRLAATTKSIVVRFTFDSAIGEVAGDASRLQQIFWNLLSNAIKFTPAGGQVNLSLTKQGNHAKIQVQDTGIGISAEFLPHVFEHFRQADSSSTRTYSGLGLGLAIVRYLVEQHGGTVRAESLGQGQGATFTVILPLSKPEEPDSNDQLNQSSSSIIDDSSLLLEGLQVLVVDDEFDTREFVAFVLEDSGAVVKAVSSASEAIKALQERKPDVLVSDIGMPEDDGYSLLSKIRLVEPIFAKQMKAIALTAYAREEDRQQALKSGFQIHMTKPVDPTNLVAAVASLSGRVSS